MNPDTPLAEPSLELIEAFLLSLGIGLLMGLERSVTDLARRTAYFRTGDAARYRLRPARDAHRVALAARRRPRRHRHDDDRCLPPPAGCQ